jgi:DNA-binding HxlR family transcriptional regulator
MERRVLLEMLAEAATGAEVVNEDELPDPDEPVSLEIIADPYLVEPVDPTIDPSAIDEDTLLKPSQAGQDLLFVGSVLERWLRDCPSGSLELGPDSAPALSALLNGWSSSVIHALAAKPLTTAEIVKGIGVLDYDTVEERVEEMVDADLLIVLDAAAVGAEERFAATEWLRTAIAPLATAARQELRHPLDDTAPIAALDVQAAFLLTLPLLKLPVELSGTCSLAVDLDEGVVGSPTGVTARIEKGELISCEARLTDAADAWATASAPDWLDAVIDRDSGRVRSDGDDALITAVLRELHEALFAP